VFAGAAREAVFSQSDVIRRVQADFIPVALKAGFVDNPGDHAEGRHYREIRRSRPAPQGICVANSDGRVLMWALSFDAPSRIEDFLDRAAKRFAEFPDASRPVAAERYMKFPSMKIDDVADAGTPAPAAVLAHPKGSRCPATPPVPKGTLIAKLVGRALAADGTPLADAVRQEHYVEDRLEIPPAPQEAFARAMAEAGAERRAVPDPLARLLVGHAFLGQLDVDPTIGGAAPKRCELWATKQGPGVYRIEGRSELSGGEDSTGNARVDGRRWRHEVTLSWEGLIEVRELQIIRVAMSGRGREKLTWGNAGVNFKEEDVTHLPAGHAIDLDAGVRYGLRAEPAADAEAGDPELPAGGLPGKLAALGPAVHAYLRSGGDASILQPEMEKLHKLLDGRDADGAEKQIERIREIVKKK
jgi:hypothetical protein